MFTERKRSAATRFVSASRLILLLGLFLILAGCAGRAPHLAKTPSDNAAELYAQAKDMAHDAGVEKQAAIAAYEKAVRAGSVEAACELAEYYLSGVAPVKPGKNESEQEAADKAAFSLYLQAAKVGYPPAQYKVATMYADERGVARDMDEARAWLHKAGESGDAGAQRKLAHAYAEGCTCDPDCVCGSTCEYKLPQDSAKAAYWSEKLLNNSAASDKGQAAYELGCSYERGFDGKPDYIAAAKFYAKAVAAGNDDALSSLAFLYFRGRGLPHDYEKAVSMHEDLVARNGEQARGYNLGVLYYYAPAGKDQARRHKEAVRLFKDSAKNEFYYAQSALGECYENGVGVARNYKEAAKWYGLAAEQGFADAKFFLGDLYRRGLGVTRDYSKALSLFKEAADSDLAWGKRGLAGMYYRGEGAERDYESAFQLYSDAAAADDQESMFLLAQMYERGEGTEKDSAEARNWYRKAADYPLYEGHYYEPEKVAKYNALARAALDRLK